MGACKLIVVWIKTINGFAVPGENSRSIAQLFK